MSSEVDTKYYKYHKILEPIANSEIKGSDVL